jgi:hypothetical protein
MATNKTESMRPKREDTFRRALVELEGMRDDIRVRIHLAGMELKQAWDDLDRRYLALRDVATTAKDEALTKARRGLVEIRKELRDMRTTLDRVTRSMGDEEQTKPS